VYYFDPCSFDIKPGDGVIVETARGMEYGTVTMGITEIKEEDVTKPLKKIIRIADESDIRRSMRKMSRRKRRPCPSARRRSRSIIWR
jgi:cell fate regulator YaaT (PSP1 superfamily)